MMRSLWIRCRGLSTAPVTTPHRASTTAASIFVVRTAPCSTPSSVLRSASRPVAEARDSPREVAGVSLHVDAPSDFFARLRMLR